MRSIREATQSDLDQLMIWAMRFHALSNWVLVPFSERRVRQTLSNMIEADHSVILMHDQGMIGGVIAELWIADRHSSAQEMFWYAEKDGGQLLEAFKDWGREKGAQFMIVSGLKDPTGRIQKVYERKGFELVEYHYRIRL